MIRITAKAMKYDKHKICSPDNCTEDMHFDYPTDSSTLSVGTAMKAITQANIYFKQLIQSYELSAYILQSIVMFNDNRDEIQVISIDDFIKETNNER